MSFQPRPPPSPPPSSSSPSSSSPAHDVHAPALSSQTSFSSTSTDSTSTSDSSSLATPFEHLRLREHSSSPHRTLKDTPNDYARAPHIQDLDPDVEMLERMHESRASTPSSPSHRTRPLLQHSHTQYYQHSPSSATIERPSLPRRNTSFSKRHASFDTPREVPLPYMPSQVQQAPHSPSSSRIISQDVGHAPSSAQGSPQAARASGLDSASSGAPGPSALRSSPAPMEQSPRTSSSPSQSMDTAGDTPPPATRTTPPDARRPDRHPHHQYRRNMSGPVQMYGRPASSPEAPSTHIHSPKPMHATAPADTNRNSTLSLPLPAHTPFHTLPSLSGPSSGAIPEGQVMPGPPPTATVPASASYPQDAASARPGTASTRASSQSNSSFVTRPPDWLREYSEPRRNVSPTSMDLDGIPVPQPPTILTPPPQPHSNAPHEPFLAHAPPPNDSYIAVETGTSEYRLIVRLPGFRRDSITLSTRRRRILHIVADSWEPGGGHFERRISFGYDADLAQVRAEFDGDLLRIIVPRRVAPMTYWGTRT